MATENVSATKHVSNKESFKRIGDEKKLTKVSQLGFWERRIEYSKNLPLTLQNERKAMLKDGALFLNLGVLYFPLR